MSVGRRTGSNLKIVQDRSKSAKARVTACFDRRRNKAELVLCNLRMFGLWIWRVFKFLYGPRLHSSAANPIATSFEAERRLIRNRGMQLCDLS